MTAEMAAAQAAAAAAQREAAAAVAALDAQKRLAHGLQARADSASRSAEELGVLAYPRRACLAAWPAMQHARAGWFGQVAATVHAVQCARDTGGRLLAKSGAEAPELACAGLHTDPRGCLARKAWCPFTNMFEYTEGLVLQVRLAEALAVGERLTAAEVEVQRHRGVAEEATGR